MSIDLEAVAAEVRRRVDDTVRDGDGRSGVGGAAWAVAVGDDVVTGSAGRLHPGRTDEPMPDDAVFRIASVSKPIAAVAALQLVDDGLIGLDDPVVAALPELAGRRVLVDPAGSIDGPSVAAHRSLTVRDLLSFRCGLGMVFDESTPQPVVEQMWEWGIGPGPTGPSCPPDEFLEQLGRLPLSDQPGTRWRYHTGSDIAGVLVERLRGEPLDVTIEREVCGPLGMGDTGFTIRPEHTHRVTTCRSMNDDEVTVWDEPDGRWAQPPAFRSGAAGLVSTTTDLVAFGRMLLARGAGPGGRVLSAQMTTEMSTDQLDDRQRRLAAIGEGDDTGWGLGIGVRHRASPAGWPGAGSLGWDGGLGSRFLVDPATDFCAVVCCTDAYHVPGTVGLLDAFVDAITRATKAARAAAGAT